MKYFSLFIVICAYIYAAQAKVYLEEKFLDGRFAFFIRSCHPVRFACIKNSVISLRNDT